ncbi:hypothetical protein GGQ71_001574 [Rhizobium taibaishanense]|uniref:Transfer Agent n=1 Tax=Allorhizobium taibaishanense TaxID=887144 RepID=A0A7W6HL80_9HYPH|nr:hypothetical protein [Allorhizobium taibaishanense]
MSAARGVRANRRRGEVEAVIDGERRILCLTLGALAELETAFAADSLADLAARFSTGKLSSRDLIRILAAGLRGGGNCCADEDVADMCVDGGLSACVAIVRELLLVTFGEPAADRPAAERDERAAGEAALKEIPLSEIRHRQSQARSGEATRETLGSVSGQADYCAGDDEDEAGFTADLRHDPSSGLGGADLCDADLGEGTEPVNP